MSLLIDILVFIGLALLGLEFLRRLIRRFVPGAKEIHLDGAYLILVLIGAYLLYPKAADEEALRRSLKKTEQALTTAKDQLETTRDESLQTKKLLEATRKDLKAEQQNREKATADLLKTQNDLINAQKELNDVNKRESLRTWAMLLPTGDLARDSVGKDITPGGQRNKDFGKVFQSEGGGYNFAGPKRCETKAYLDDIRYLMTRYDKSPYPRVALAYCLKHLGDKNWKKEALQAKSELEFYMGIEPHVILLEGFHHFVMRLFDSKIKPEDTGFSVRREDNTYRPKNMPP